jgi:hypothetical protein
MVQNGSGAGRQSFSGSGQIDSHLLPTILHVQAHVQLASLVEASYKHEGKHVLQLTATVER